MSKKYINADLIIEKLENRLHILFQNYLHDGNKNRTSYREYAKIIASVNHIKSILQDATADVRENVRGKWVHRRYIAGSGRKVDMVYCIKCGEEYSYDAETGVSADDYKFCPNCGKYNYNRPKITSVDMRGRQDDSI